MTHQYRDVEPEQGDGAPVPPPIGNAGEGTKGTTKLRKLDLADLASREPEPIPWKIDKLAAKGELTMVFGVGGVAKSLAMMALCNGVIRDEEVAGIACHHGRALYFDAENGKREIHRRVHGLGLSPELDMYEVSGLNLNDPDDFALVERLIAAEREHGTVIVFDSLRTLLPGVEENDSGAMSKALTNLRTLAHRYDVAIIVIHHSDKLGRTFRGSSAIRDQVTLSFKLGREKSDPHRRRFLDTDKFRVGDEPERRWFRLVIEPPQIYLEAVEAPDPDAKEAPSYPPLGQAVLILFDHDGHISLTLSEIAQQLDKNSKSGHLRRVLERLVKDGQLARDESGYTRCPSAPRLGKHDEGTGAETLANPVAEPSFNGAPPGAPTGTEGTVDLSHFRRSRKRPGQQEESQ